MGDFMNAPRADFMLARLFATTLFGVFMFIGGYLSADVRNGKELRVCEEKQRKVQAIPQTKAEKAAFIQYYSNRGM